MVFGVSWFQICPFNPVTKTFCLLKCVKYHICLTQTTLLAVELASLKVNKSIACMLNAKYFLKKGNAPQKLLSFLLLEREMNKS